MVGAGVQTKAPESQWDTTASSGLAPGRVWDRPALLRPARPSIEIGCALDVWESLYLDLGLRTPAALRLSTSTAVVSH